ncbi:helix-turn-helix domain-containing protein [Desulfovibrio sp. ZJ369]|uniref:helix-turn-helix domain-containing protein n=1 Tax=Desulfovibrio sp. ZJ369 TaxID=2709793 RepID=UPI0013ECAEBF|nr:helix-turn-helix domain-containing protein [Desulfovibrio sp. ZJ369]
MSLTKKKHKQVREMYLKSLLLDVDAYLDTHYTFRCEKRYRGLLGKFLAWGDIQRVEEHEAKISQEHYRVESVYGSSPDAVEMFRKYMKPEESFGEKLVRLMEAKGLDPVVVYKKANIDRKLFSKIKTQKDYLPSKRTVMALAIAMELPLEETQSLLREAGFAFSPSILSDVIVEYFISHQKYDFDEINAALYAYDKPIF